MHVNLSFNQPRNVRFLLITAVVVGVFLGTAIAIFSPPVIAAALVVILAVTLVMKNPVYGILGFLALTSTVLDSTSNLGISIGFGHIYLSDIVLFSLFWLIGWNLIMHLEEKFVRTPLDVPLLLFNVVMVGSTIVAMMKGAITLQGVLGPMRAVINLMIFYAVTNLVKTKKQLWVLRRGIIFFASIVSLVMIAQYAMGTTLPFIPGRVEVLATEGTKYYSVTRIIPPGYSTVFATFVTVCAIWFFDKKKSGNLLLTIPIILTAVGVLLTFKRNLWVALGLIFLIMALISTQKEIQRILLRGFSTFAIMLVGFFVIMNYTGSTGPDLIHSSADRLFSLFRLDTYQNPDSSLRWRDFENENAIPHIISNPFIGTGLGTIYRPWVPDRDWSEYDGRSYIHNGYYWLLLRTGGIGFLLMMGTLITAIVRGFKYWRMVPNGAYVLGYSMAIIGMLLGNWVAPMISEWEWTALLSIMLGMNELAIRFQKQDLEKFRSVENKTIPLT